MTNMRDALLERLSDARMNTVEQFDDVRSYRKSEEIGLIKVMELGENSARALLPEPRSECCT